MNESYDVIIIGAGLAGCSAAIQLAQRGHRILLLEQAEYPTHRLCGEFLSIEVIEIFQRLGILDAVHQAGAHPIQRAYLTATSGASFRCELPGTALGLSRYQLDRILFERAQAAGATCHQGMPVRSVTGSFATGFVVNSRGQSFISRLVLGAYGKGSSLDHKLQRPFIQRKSPWVASKAHYDGIQLPHLIELHAFPGGYCGLSQIEAGQVNVCWIAHERVLKGAGKLGSGDCPERPDRPDRHCPDALYQNPVLADRLTAMRRVTPPQNLAQISFARKAKFEGDLCMIGDSGGMITPLCGDGMAMALSSADLAVPLVHQVLQERLSTAAFKQQYQGTWRKAFELRLQLGRLMHTSFVHPPLADIGIQLCQGIPALGQWLIQSTRGKPSSPGIFQLPETVR
jgi:menaquinone-9 beta-reductase